MVLLAVVDSVVHSVDRVVGGGKITMDRIFDGLRLIRPTNV